MIRQFAAGVLAIAVPPAAADTRAMSPMASTPASPTTSAAASASMATGTFDVKITPTSAADAPIGAMALAKTFHGDIEGSSIGTMLAFRTAIDGSAGYVAMERVTATIAGRRGSFVLQHSGTLDRGRQALAIAVVPDSATDALAGLSGTMTIDTSGGGHAYAFRYVLPAIR